MSELGLETAVPIQIPAEPFWQFTLSDGRVGSVYKVQAPTAEEARAILADRLKKVVPETSIRAQVFADAQGLISQTFSRHTLSFGNAALVSGNIYCTALALLAGDVVTSIVMLNDRSIAGLTRVELALLAADGTVLATTGDVKDDFGDPGVKVEPLLVPYNVAVSDLFYCAFHAHGEEVPVVAQSNWIGNTPAYSSFAIGAGRCLWAEMEAQTDMPSVVVLGPPVSIAPAAVWFGIA
jgi:hypothetical protein